MLITIASLHGAPGVTTAAAALSAHWPEDESVPTVVECDPVGGDLLLRYGLALHPSLADVAAALAAGTVATETALAEGTQTINVAGRQAPVVVAAPGGAQTRSALPVLTAPHLKVLNPPGTVVIADVGRLDPTGPAWPVAVSADLVLLVIEGTLGAVGHLRFRLDQIRALESLGAPVAVAVREADYTSRDVADAFRAQGLDLRVLGPLGPAPNADAPRRRHRRTRRPGWWTALAEAVRKAASARPLALTAAQSTSDEEYKS